MKEKEKQLFINLCKPNSHTFDKSLLSFASPNVLGHLFFNRMQATAYGTLRRFELLNNVNREFRNVDAPTDVLSFPQNELEPGKFDASACERDMDTGAVLLGDMMISLPRCERQGEEYGHGFKRELMYLTVHSVLHLLGYDHVDEGEMKAQMRQREKAIMGDET